MKNRSIPAEVEISDTPLFCDVLEKDEDELEDDDCGHCSCYWDDEAECCDCGAYYD